MWYTIYTTSSICQLSHFLFYISPSLHVQLGQTPLMRAAKKGHAEVVWFLLRNGSSVKEQDNVGSPSAKGAAFYVITTAYIRMSRRSYTTLDIQALVTVFFGCSLCEKRYHLPYHMTAIQTTSWQCHPKCLRYVHAHYIIQQVDYRVNKQCLTFILFTIRSPRSMHSTDMI